MSHSQSSSPKRILLLGATGTIGLAVAMEVAARGDQLVCFIRPQSDPETQAKLSALNGVEIRFGDVSDAGSLAQDGFKGERFDGVISCLASRTGVAKEAWAIDHQANLSALDLAEQAGVPHFVLLSAICVQKPKLAFQHAKLAFEQALIASGLTYSIVRPTAFFKSLSGQVARVKAGKPYMIFGNGQLTACKPISDGDLARFIVDCFDQPGQHNRILPIGGPGPAITPKQQGEHLFAELGRPPKYSAVPPAMLLWISRLLKGVSWLYPPLKARAEYARIGHYYATESMLVWDEVSGSYRADLTPSTGTETLFEHYRDLLTRD